jgi:hypothetical protein
MIRVVVVALITDVDVSVLTDREHHILVPCAFFGKRFDAFFGFGGFRGHVG